MQENSIQIQDKKFIDLSSSEKEQIKRLRSEIFADVPQEEIQQDFYAIPFAVILATVESSIVGYCGLFKRMITFNEHTIHLGGLGGLMTAPRYRGQGIGGRMVERALGALQEEKVDVAFLSVDTTGTMSTYYEKYGFVLMNQEFSWKRKSGSIESDYGGMIAPVCSKEFFQQIIDSHEGLYIGDGYW